MDIPSAVVTTLRSLDSSVTKDQLECILSHVVVYFRGSDADTLVSTAGCHKSAVHSNDDHSNDDHSNDDHGHQEQLVNAIVSLFKQACRCNISLESESDQIRSILESAGVTNDVQIAIVEKYQGIRSLVLEQLKSPRFYGQTSIPIQQVVDADYRQEFIVSNSDLDKVSSINYLISLKTAPQTTAPQADQSRNSGLESDLNSIDFTCSLQDLQDLVTKLREASKCVENVIK